MESVAVDMTNQIAGLDWESDSSGRKAVVPLWLFPVTFLPLLLSHSFSSPIFFIVPGERL